MKLLISGVFSRGYLWLKLNSEIIKVCFEMKRKGSGTDLCVS